MKCELLYEKIKKALYIAEVVNRRENLFKMKKSDFNDIEVLKS